MIGNTLGTVFVSSLGGVDHDAIGVFDGRTQAARQVSLGSGANFVLLHRSGTDRFAVSHHYSRDPRFEITIHNFSEPERVLARAILTASENGFSGDADAWNHVPRLYRGYLGFVPWKDFSLISVAPDIGKLSVQRFNWYDETFDKGYQGIVDVLEIPGENAALVSVQRSSDLIMHDLATGNRKATLKLAGRWGNPALYFRRRANEVWASDYDTIVVIDAGRWEVSRSSLLQEAPHGTQQFIGNYFFSPDEQHCVVARPLSSDVVSIDPATLKVIGRAALGKQPLDVGLFQDDHIVARDWKTGTWLHGKLDRVRA